MGSFCESAWFSTAVDRRLARQSAEQRLRAEQPVGGDAFAPTVLKRRELAAKDIAVAETLVAVAREATMWAA